MPTAKSNSPRRREMRRQTTRSLARWRPQRRHQPMGWAIVFGGALALLGAIIAISAEDAPHYHLGQIVEEPIVPRVAFSTIDKDKTETRKEKARRQVLPHYRFNATLHQQLREGLDRLLSVAGHDQPGDADEPGEQFQLSEPAREALRHYVKNGETTDAWARMESEFLQRLFGQAGQTLVFLSEADYERANNTGFGRIIIDPPPQDQRTRKSAYTSNWRKLSNTSELKAQLQQFAEAFPEPLQSPVVTIALDAMTDEAGNGQPTYRFDQAWTQARRQQKVDAVDPVPMSFNPAKDVLVPAGKELSNTDLYLIKQERDAFRASQAMTDRWMSWLGMLGLFVALAAGLWAYNFAYNEKLVRNPMRGLALTGLLLLMQLLAAVMTQAQPEFIFFTTTLPTLLAVVILTITYDRRFGLGVGVMHAVVVLLTLNLTIGLTLTLLTGVAVAVAQLQEIRTRSKLVTVGMWTGLAMGAVAMLAAGSMRPLYIENAFHRLLGDAGWAVLAGAAAGLLAQGVLPGIERLFKVTTAMTLKELNDASHPLLQRLAQQAPGTYQHSLRIADMAESSADAIGADGLLCRVGAMYHDIGKINKPQYFIENQGGGPNRHSRLSPAMSLLIIVGHVKDGIEMAREYGLPPVLRHFIESHHGTTLVEYFYHAARRQQEAEAKPGPSEFEFRYPGPKPQTKEAAILLLCDSIEGAARSLDEPTPVRLDQVVHTMANKRLMDGQFDECNLTLKELARIEQAITKTLCAIYHGRIKYPAGESEQTELETGPATSPHPRTAAS